MRRWIGGLLIAAGALLPAPGAGAADLTADQVRATLTAAVGHAADFSGKNLAELDLSGLDFSHANLAKADLFGAKLVGAKFVGARLAGARLDLAWIMRADFTDADLSEVSLFGPVVSFTMAPAPPSEAPRFPGANFSGARIIARLAGVDLRGARFVNAGSASISRTSPWARCATTSPAPILPAPISPMRTSIARSLLSPG